MDEVEKLQKVLENKRRGISDSNYLMIRKMESWKSIVRDNKDMLGHLNSISQEGNFIVDERDRDWYEREQKKNVESRREE